MIHLHVHDAQGSLLDSTNRPEDLARRAKELGMPALAITNHGYVSSIVQFYKACKDEGVKPIIGCEFYVTDDINIKDQTSKYDHLIVIAKNSAGYKNILKMSSIGFSKEAFYYKPRIDMSILKEYSEGLIVTSACLGATIPKMIRRDEPDEMVIAKINEYDDMFETFFLEVQGANNSEQEKVNKKLAKLSKVTGVPLVATTDVHFLTKEDFDLHGVFIQINQDRDNEVYQDCWLKSESEVFQVLEKHIGFEDTIEAIANTHKIAEMCDLEIELEKSYLPKFPVPDGFDSEDEYLHHLVDEGMKVRGIDQSPFEEQLVYMARIEEEMEIITKKGFSGYFTIVADFLQSCRDADIYTGDGRGSADNSLVCYLTEITNVDPIEYDLNFSRFLTMERKALPDIDMDIQSSRKHDAVNILRDKYGWENVAQICTHGSMQAKAAMDKLGKVLNIPIPEIAKIKKHIPDLTKLSDALEKSSALRIYQEKYPQLFDYALRLEGLPTNISVHAGGVVICPSDKEMSDFTALARSVDGDIITQLDMGDVEAVGLVKMDVLGIITLDVVADTLDMVFGCCGR